MNFLVERLRFLGLNDREIRVFTALSTFGRMTMTKIATRAGVPRTTADAIVRRLIDQGLITQEKVRNHHEYSVELNKVADTLDWIEQRLRPKDDTKKQGNIKRETINDENIVINEAIGTNCISDSFKERAGDRTRVLLARKPDDITDALTRFTEYVKDAVESNTKLEVLACAFVADSVREGGMNEIKWADPNLIRLNVVPGSYCRAESDLVIFPDRVIVRSIYANDVHTLSEPTTVESMKHLLDIACETGWSVNLSTWLGRM